MRQGGDKFQVQGRGGEAKGGRSGAGQGLHATRPEPRYPSPLAACSPGSRRRTPLSLPPDPHSLKHIFRVIHGERIRASSSPSYAVGR